MSGRPKNGLPTRCTIILFSALALLGCKQAVPHTRDAVSPKIVFEANLRPLADEWLGKTRDARIKAKGFPDRCSKVEDNEVVCEWLAPGQHHLIYIYDSHGLARAWSYRGPFGSFGSEQKEPAGYARDEPGRQAGSSVKSYVEQVGRSL